MNQRTSSYQPGVAVSGRRAWLATVIILLTLAAAGVFTTARASAQSAPERDFFGRVLLAQGNLLMVATEDTTVAVVITPDTRVRLSLKRDAKVTDLVPGDRVAVSLAERNGRLVADKVFLVPNKPRYRHVPGTVVALSLSQITIQPTEASAARITFAAAPTTPVRFRDGVITLSETADFTNSAVGALRGRFVVVSAAMRSDGPQQAVEVLVMGGPPQTQSPAPTATTFVAQPAKRVEVRGVFTGVDPDGRWIFGGTRMRVDPEVTVDRGLAVGQAVHVKSRVGPDGALYAVSIEREYADPRITQRVRLDGVFQGLDSQGRWVISGAAVTVGAGSNTDELPYVGQRVRVVAARQEDGSLLALAVENQFGAMDEVPNLVNLLGVLEGVDQQGKWTVSGIKVAVGPSTKLESSPTVGQPVQVTAVGQNGSPPLALRIEGRQDEITQRRGQARVVGAVNQVLDNGGLVINGITVTVSALTAREGNVRTGDQVTVDAVLLEDGTLLAREIRWGLDVEVVSPGIERQSEIRGAVQQVNPDGTVLINGILVEVGKLAEVKADLTSGNVVTVQGILQSDGSLLAREVAGEFRRDRWGSSEVRISGRISQVDRDAGGNPMAVVVNGSRIAVEPLTRLEGPLEEGRDIQITGIVRSGGVLAIRIKEQNGGGPAALRLFKLEGWIESLHKDGLGQATHISINGLAVRILPTTRVEGALDGGDLVEVDGALVDGFVVADRVVARRAPAAIAPRTQFRLNAAVVEATGVTPRGKLGFLVVGGRTILVEGLSKLQAGVAVGVMVEVEGVMVGEAYVATKVSVVDPPQVQSEVRRPDRNGDKDRDRKGGSRGDGGKSGSSDD